MPDTGSKGKNTCFSAGKKFLFAVQKPEYGDTSPEDVAARLNEELDIRDDEEKLPHWFQGGKSPKHARDFGVDGARRVLLVFEHDGFYGEIGESAPQSHAKGGGGGTQIYVNPLPRGHFRVASHEEHGRDSS